MKLPLSRPLNVPIITIEIDQVSYHFLIDTGCPISFARRLRVIASGSLFPDEPLALRPSPFSLDPFSELLGVPIEGFIGLRDLVRLGHLYFDWDAGALEVGVPMSHLAKAVTEGVGVVEADKETDQEVTGVRSGQRSMKIQHLQLVELRGAPIGVQASLDDQALTWFVDTGSRFISIPDGHTLTLDQSRSQHHTTILSPLGSLDITLTPNHAVTVGSTLYDGLCIAEGMPASHPFILGMEWITLYNAYFDFIDHVLTLSPRARPALKSTGRERGDQVTSVNQTAERPVWEAVRSGLLIPPFEINLTPTQFAEPDRAIYVLPSRAAPLPEGLLPFTPYRVKGFKIPPGLEGVNALYEHLNVTSELEASFTLVDPQENEHLIKRRHMFT